MDRCSFSVTWPLDEIDFDTRAYQESLASSFRSSASSLVEPQAFMAWPFVRPQESLASSFVRSAWSLVEPHALSKEFLARPRYDSAVSWPL